MVTFTATEIEYAALADFVYRRSNLDQPLTLTEINGSLALETDYVAFALSNPPSRLLVDDEPPNDEYYYSERGFGAQVYQKGSDYVVVFRGTDTTSFDPVLVGTAAAFGVSLPPRATDAPDWKQNVGLGIGDSGSDTQARDAIELTQALIARLTDDLGEGNFTVSAVGQSLGGGLAGIDKDDLTQNDFALMA